MLRPTIDALLAQKQITPELGEGPRIMALHEYINAQFAALRETIALQSVSPVPEWADLNKLFLRILRKGR